MSAYFDLIGGFGMVAVGILLLIHNYAVDDGGFAPHLEDMPVEISRAGLALHLIGAALVVCGLLIVIAG